MTSDISRTDAIKAAEERRADLNRQEACEMYGAIIAIEVFVFQKTKQGQSFLGVSAKELLNEMRGFREAIVKAASVETAGIYEMMGRL